MKKIELTSEIANALDTTITAFIQINDNQEQQYSFITTNKEYIKSINPAILIPDDDDEYNDDEYDEYDEYDESDDPTVTYNLITGERLIQDTDNGCFASFYGEIYSIASFSKPNYAKYLDELTICNYKINLENQLFSIETNESVYIENDNDSIKLYLSSDNSFIDYIDEIGRSIATKELIVSNLSLTDFKNVFTEKKGFLYLGEQTGLKFISNNIVELIRKDGDYLKNLQIQKENYCTIPVISIYFKDTLIDNLVLKLNDENIDWDENFEVEVDF